MLSIRELNNCLCGIDNQKQDGYVCVFDEIDRVDMAFIAGLLLKYELAQKDDWKRPSIKFKLTDENRLFELKQYFAQYSYLYGVDWNNVFTKFSYVTNNPEKYDSRKIESLYSSSFAPIIYIDDDTISWFFKSGEQQEAIQKIKTIYIEKIQLSEFIDQRFKTYRGNEELFLMEFDKLKRRLQLEPAIFTFIFSVTYHKLAEDEYYKDKNKEDKLKAKSMRTVDDFKDFIEKIFFFTKEYVRGLYELAKNIVEHSGNGNKDGKGMITIRAYSNQEMDKKKTLETHIFDFGTTGIIPKLKEYTKKKIILDEKELKRSQIKINNAYKSDLEKFEEEFSLENYIQEMKLEQQQIRHIGHYGINKLKRIITGKPLYGEILIRSIGLENNPDFFGVNAEKLILNRGTHYLLKVEFREENFTKIYVPETKSHEFSTIGSSEALQELMKKTIMPITLDDLNQPQIEDKKDCNVILDLKISVKIDKAFQRNASSHFKIFSDLIHPRTIAMNLDNCIQDNHESDLLRFLGSLTEEYIHTFIIYNVNFATYKMMLDDNKEFVNTRKWSTFWHDEKGVLVYTKVNIDTNDANLRGVDTKTFYFADFLHGSTNDDYYAVNKIINNTFPNTESILNNDRVINNFKMSCFPDIFYKNVLLPYDVLLKGRDGKELFLSNLQTVLRNGLFNRKILGISILENQQFLENYITNRDGYSITDTHFRIGNKVHSDTFIYAKGIFHNSFYTSRLAMYMVKKIRDDVINSSPSTKKITIIGYEMYSELILSLIEKFLSEAYPSMEIKHLIAQNDEENMIFLPKPDFEKILPSLDNNKIVIVVPIAATGNTIQKIIDRLQEQYKQLEKKSCPIIIYKYNMILVQDSASEFDFIRQTDKDEGVIRIPVTWYHLNECKLCFEPEHSKPLFATDNSSLTPSFIFENPKGQNRTKKSIGNEIQNHITQFDELNFTKSLGYLTTKRNNNYRVFSIDANQFIKDNKQEIELWLEFLRRYLQDPNLLIDQIIKYCKEIIGKNEVSKTVGDNNEIEARFYKKYAETLCKENGIEDLFESLKKLLQPNDKIKITPADKIIIVAPCHKNNTVFINLVNEIVFSSAATIIHHQSGVDFGDNFKLLYENQLGEDEAKIFYVDDSLVTGSHFIETYDLIKKVTNNTLTGSILLSDQSTPFTHDLVVRLSKNHFAFTVINQAAPLSIYGSSSLVFEHNRYISLQKRVLHVTMRDRFRNKLNKLNPEKRATIEIDKNNLEKQMRHLKMFEATHKIYKFFTHVEKVPSFTSEDWKRDFIKLNLKSAMPVNDDITKFILLKVLSQYPFKLYKDLKKETFLWHKELIDDYLGDTSSTNDYMNFICDKEFETFKYFKFLLARATNLDNYQVLTTQFLRHLIKCFMSIDRFIMINKANKEEKNENYKDNADVQLTFDSLEREEKEKRTREREEIFKTFSIFVLGNYIEMIQENGWVAVKLLKNLNSLNINFDKQYTETRRFIRMLQVEIVSVVNDFNEIIIENKQIEAQWLVAFNITDDKLDPKNEVVFDFFKKNERKLLETNKYLIASEVLNEEILMSKEWLNYYWIKQLLYCDEKVKQLLNNNGRGHYLINQEEINKLVTFQKIDYLGKIEKIVEKAKDFFREKDIQSFFIVSDGQENYHVLTDSNSILSDTDISGQISDNDKKYERLYLFLQEGKSSDTSGKNRSIAEYERVDNIWINSYEGDETNIEFLSDSKYLLLIRFCDEIENESCRSLGLLGFYCNEIPLTTDVVLAKQLVMLLRNDISKFIIKHHENDEFTALIQQKDKNKYIYRLNHGIQDYKEAIKNILHVCQDIELKNDLTSFYDYLITKLNIISKFSSKTKLEPINSKSIQEVFLDNYKRILTIKSGDYSHLSKEQVNNDNIVNFSIEKGFDVTETYYMFPEDCIVDIIFELINNIRKNVCGREIYLITTQHPLKIDVEILEDGSNTFLCVTNNHVRNIAGPEKRTSSSEHYVPHGIDLLRELWRKNKLGRILTPEYPLKERSFTIKIQLQKDVKNEESGHNH